MRTGECVPLVEADASARFGGKAVHLGDALRAGLNVPAGFALSASLVEACVALDAQALAHVERVAAELGFPVAVRSSAVGEDTQAASFAGQHATVLNVCDELALREAVAAVHASGHSEAAHAYRRQRNLDSAVRVGVVVQRVVAAEVAGVLFTQDPVSGDPQRVIEASWGFGEAVVAGLVTPDRYRLHEEDGRVLEREAGEKDLAVRPCPGGAVEEQPVAAEQVHALCLDDAQLAQLHQLATQCQRVFGSKLDVEWAFSGATLWLLQCRPISVSR